MVQPHINVMLSESAPFSNMWLEIGRIIYWFPNSPTSFYFNCFRKVWLGKLKVRLFLTPGTVSQGTFGCTWRYKAMAELQVEPSLLELKICVSSSSQIFLSNHVMFNNVWIWNAGIPVWKPCILYGAFLCRTQILWPLHFFFWLAIFLAQVLFLYTFLRCHATSTNDSGTLESWSFVCSSSVVHSRITSVMFTEEWRGKREWMWVFILPGNTDLFPQIPVQISVNLRNKEMRKSLLTL